MHVTLRIFLRVAVSVGLFLAFLYYRLELRAATEDQFERINAERRKVSEMYATLAKEPPQMRMDM